MGVFNDIKSKLGFSGEQQDAQYDEAYYDGAGYDGEYSDDGYDQSYGTHDDSYGEYGTSSRKSNYGGIQRESDGPRLVSIDDVRARTQIPESLNRNPLPGRQVSSAQGNYSSDESRPFQSGTYRKVEKASDYMRSTDTSDRAPLHGTSRSPGYDSMFSSTAPSLSSVPSVTTANPSQTVSTRSPYDPYETYSGSGVTSHNPTRSLTILKPISYAEVERIAKILKAGDVVVLGLTNTQDQLAKRILDFSFGVSSALDASVECVADKVFVINRGRALSEEELRDVRRKV